MPEERRIDQWLWFARVVKSRSQGQRLVLDGHVRVNKVKIDKPARAVIPGDIVTAIVHDRLRVLRVLKPGSRRGPVPEALSLYDEIGE